MIPIGKVNPPPPTIMMDVDFGNQMLLQGYDLNCDAVPNACSLRLVWQATTPMERNYTVFVHLVGPDGTIVAQDDAPPGPSFFPTSTWLPGTIVDQEHVLSWASDTPDGDYTLVVGIYHQPTSERLAATDTNGQSIDDVLPLTTISIVPESP